MTPPAVQSMGRRLTLPFAQGGDTLTLPLVPDPSSPGSSALVPAYDFREHIARFGNAAALAPRYVLSARRDVPAATAVTVSYQVPGSAGTPATRSVTLQFPADSPAGSSFALVLGADEGPATRLAGLTTDPAAPGGANVADCWVLTALLGNLAKLLWVAGAERDALRGHLARIKAQRCPRQGAIGLSLDQFGIDLGVPRFPPLPYASSTDVLANTVALYHLDDLPAAGLAEVGTVADAMAPFPNKAGHPGTNALGRNGAPGRFGGGFAFRTKGAVITITEHADFDLGPADSFTAECFVKPDANPAVGHALAKHAGPSDPANAGWALSVGNFGESRITLGARFLLGDGTHVVTLSAHRNLTTDRFFHLAGVIDRTANEARLYLDGTLRDVQPLTGLGALTNAEPVRIGTAPGGDFLGIIDEVRLSRAAESTFSPVLGEDDDSYRTRLAIFEKWTLPTPANLAAILNQAVGTIGGVANPIVVDDTVQVLFTGTQPLALFPTSVAAGATMDAQGNPNVTEASVNGTAQSDVTFDPAFLAPFVAAAGSPAIVFPATTPDPHLMLISTATALQRLLNLVSSEPSGPGQLVVSGGFDPQAGSKSPDLRAVGRALVMTHSTVTLDRLAALALRAGFSFVSNRVADQTVYASLPPGDLVAIIPDAGGTAQVRNGFDLNVGDTLNLAVQPPLPSGASCQWLTLSCGAGAVVLNNPDGTAAPAGGPLGPTVQIKGVHPGALTVKVEATWESTEPVPAAPAPAAGAMPATPQTFLRRRTVSGSLGLRVGVTDLAAAVLPPAAVTSIGADGALNGDGSAAGSGTSPEDLLIRARIATYLVTFDDPRARFGTDLNTRRMQPSVALRLSGLLNLIAAVPSVAGTTQQLTVAEAFVPIATDLRALGRGLLLQHPSLSASQLAALAFTAGFTFSQVVGSQVRVFQGPGEVMTVTAPDSLDQGATVALNVAPRAAPQAVVRADALNRVFVVNRGTDSVSEVETAPSPGVVARAIKVGWRPVAAAVNPNAAHLFTADNASNTVSVVDLTTHLLVASIAVPADPIALAVHPAKPVLYVACGTAAVLVQIDTGALALTGSPLALDGPPTALAVTPDGATVWVAIGSKNEIEVIDTGTSTLLTKIALGDAPADVAFNPAGPQAYATLPATASLAVLNVASQAVTSVKKIAGSTTPARVSAAASGNVYVLDQTGGNELLILLTATGDPRTDASGTSVASLRLGDRSAGLTAVASVVASSQVAGVDRIYIADSGSDTVRVIDVAGGTTASSALLDDNNPPNPVDTWPIGSGLGEQLSWSVRPGASAQASLASTTSPQAPLQAVQAGPVVARAIYAHPGGQAPYTFEVRLQPALDGTSAIIRKDQYDLIMNILNAFHPVGVEVITPAIRERVVEVRNTQLDAVPDYTFPNFRVRGPLPGRLRKD